MTQALITFSEVGWRRDDTNILSDINFSIAPKEIVTLIGPNGSGKTSLVKLVIGLEQASHGQISRMPNIQIGYMPQHLHFDNSLPITVERFINLTTQDKGSIHAYCERLGITRLLNTQLQNLSGGEIQRVLLTRAVLRKPQLLVLDEPTQGVDVAGQAELYRYISELRDELNCGVLMVSHDLHLVMAKTDTVICLNHHICCQGEPESVTQHPEYLELFGESAAQAIAVYTHDHDHEHDLHGDIIDEHSHKGCNHH